MKLQYLFSHATTQRTQRKAIKTAVSINCFKVFVASLRSLRETGFKGLIIPLILHVMLLSPAYGVDAPALADFARTIPLTLTGTGALHKLPLPAEVYSGAQRADLGDLAVFNGAGEIVPFTLVQPPSAGTVVEKRGLPLFPLLIGARRQPGNLSMQVRTNEQGAIINLTASPGGATPAAVNTYLIDASSLERTVSGFDFELQPGGEDFVGSVRVATSDDLHHWQEHACGALATLAAGTQQLSCSRIEFAAVKARYFRLTVDPGEKMPRITAVSARLVSAVAPPERSTARFFINPVKGQTGDYLVQTGGRMPVDRLRLVLSDDNSLAGVTFFSRTDNKSPWTERGSSTFYRLRRDSSLVESAALEISPTTDCEWLLRIRQPGSAPGEKLPMLEIGWQPRELIFAARGEPPYRLAFGSTRSGENNLRDDTLAAGLATWEKQQIRPLPALAGASVESGGKNALRPTIPATTWRKLMLWGALLGGVLLLARMAWKLSREMGQNEAQKNTAENERHVVAKGEK